ncbi:MAG: phosphoribosylanthranilate isomerase [Desulfobulbaceae bacterium]|nr:phosphoribosylanthranilate isomerase [Desulfobulbaceae bacterium]
MNVRTRIKVCGMTDKSEVADTVAAGVDALGFIFVKESPRKVEPDKVRAIVGDLPPFVDAVGVFVDEKAEVVDEIVQYCGLTMVQLHGAESPEYCEKISTRAVKAFRVGPESTKSDLTPYEGKIAAFLLDTYSKKAAGGTGKTFDWRLVEAINPPGFVILAGGLTPDNVGEAIKQVRPLAVDVNSGVETMPGKKDINEIRRFVEEVRKADLSAGN